MKRAHKTFLAITIAGVVAGVGVASGTTGVITNGSLRGGEVFAESTPRTGGWTTANVGKAQMRARVIALMSGKCRKEIYRQLVSEGYYWADAAYAADHSNISYSNQAAKRARAYIRDEKYDYLYWSYNRLYMQLRDDGFTPEQTKYGLDHSGVDFYEQAKKAKDKLQEIYDSDTVQTIKRLVDAGFTVLQVLYALGL